MEIVEFLTARLDEREQLARAATPGPWSPEKPFLSDVVTSALLGRVADCAVGTDYRAQSLEDARHIAYHDPAHVLTEVAAQREIINDYLIVTANNAIDEANGADAVQVAARTLIAKSLRMVLVRLAAPYADHPDYAEATAQPSQ